MIEREANDIVHFVFPGLFGAIGATGKTSTALTYVATKLSRPPTKCGDMCAQVDSMSPRFVPTPGTLSSRGPCNQQNSILHSRATS